ncbi:MAG: DUF3604 domain-containing protein, partial [Deltaproteobacteria bacterium]|nr:DUF3604 domain-containing protein [Deltaproteobacteria bacterium]
PDALCEQPDLVEVGYRDGVPMGADLRLRTEGDGAPTFVLSALADPDGAGLGSLQLVKGWVEPSGQTREAVIDVVTAPPTGELDLATCTPAEGARSLCATWTDPDFDPDSPAFYYVRVLEVPTCRWSQHVCVELGVDCDTLAAGDPLALCCDEDGPPRSIEERAWTSPIWYGGAERPPAP